LGQADQIELELSKLADQVKTTESATPPGKNSLCTGDFMRHIVLSGISHHVLSDLEHEKNQDHRDQEPT